MQKKVPVQEDIFTHVLRKAENFLWDVIPKVSGTDMRKVWMSLFA